MKKTIIAALLLTMCFSLHGCASGDDLSGETVILRGNAETESFETENDTERGKEENRKETEQETDEENVAATEQETDGENIAATEQESEEEAQTIKFPTKEDVEAARELALAGMSEEEISRLKENIKVANQTMEKAYLTDNIFERLSDKESLYWNYFDQKGDIQIGEDVTVYNRFDADNFVTLMEEMKSSVNDAALADSLEQLIQLTKEAKENRDVEAVRNIYKLLHDMDYYLLRYGPDDVAIYAQDSSLICTYYGTLTYY